MPGLQSCSDSSTTAADASADRRRHGINLAIQSVLTHRLRLIAAYGLIGPLIGALVVVSGMLLTDDGEEIGNPAMLLLLAFAFSYPFGIIPAIAAGVAHVIAERRLQRAGIIAAVCVFGMLTALIPLFWFGNPDHVLASVASLFGFVLSLLVAALVLSTVITRRR